MSSTRGGADPSALYVTPDWTVDAVLQHLPLGGTILDAGCGEGAILARVIEKTRWEARGYVGVELNSDRSIVARRRIAHAHKATIFTQDFLSWRPGSHAFELIIMNPSFGIAEEFIRNALALTKPVNGSVAALLPSDWHIPGCRSVFAKEHPFDLGWLSRRPAFAASLKCKGRKAPAVDAAACGWKVMQRLTDERPKACPQCGGGVSVTTNDSSNYGWLIWGPGRGGRFFPLEIPDRETAAATAGTSLNATSKGRTA